MSDDAPDRDDEPREERPRRGPPPASEKQVNFIKVLQKQVSLSDADLETLVEEVTGGGLDDLTTRSASEVIDELKIKGREQGIDLDSQPKLSDKQLGFLKSLKRRALLTDDEFTQLLQDMGGVEAPDDLGRRDASKVIDHLLKKADQGGSRRRTTRKTVEVRDDAPAAPEGAPEGGAGSSLDDGPPDRPDDGPRPYDDPDYDDVPF
jgi:hypothetical protein